MLKPEQVPDAVVKAFDEEYLFGEGDWKRNCLAAAINAWPGVVLYPPDVLDNTINPTRIILPLTQEKSDE